MGSQSLADLHEAIFDSFDLDPGHLYSFFMSNKFWDGRTAYSHPEADDDKPADKVGISRLNLEIKQKFCYLYDYGDEYRFEVELTAVKDPEKDLDYPRESKRSHKLLITRMRNTIHKVLASFFTIRMLLYCSNSELS